MAEEDLDISELIYKWIKQGEVTELLKYLQGVSNPDEVIHASLLYNYSPLHWAVKREREDMIRLLVQYGCDIEACVSPLRLAIDVNNSTVFTALCEYGANLASNDESSLISRAASKSSEVFKTVLQQPGLQLNAIRLYSLFDVYGQCGDIHREINRQYLEDFRNKFAAVCLKTGGRRGHALLYCSSMGYYALLYALCKFFRETLLNISESTRQYLLVQLSGPVRKHVTMICTKQYIPLIVAELRATSLGAHHLVTAHVPESSPSSVHDCSVYSESDAPFPSEAFLAGAGGGLSVTVVSAPMALDKTPVYGRKRPV